MRRLRATVVGLGLGVLILALTPIWLGYRVVTDLTTRARKGRVEAIRRVVADDDAISTAIAEGRPVIIEGILDRLGLSGVATPDALVRDAGSRSLTMTSFDADAPYFLYSGGYGARQVDSRTVTVEEFVDLMFGAGPEPGTVVYRLLGIQALDGAIEATLRRFDDAVRSVCTHATEVRFSGVWIGSTGAVTPLHHDAWPGLLFQTYGTKRVTMFGPQDRVNLSFRSPLHGSGRWSELPGRSRDAPAEDFPRLARTVRYEATLRPGDALYIPPFWAHEMEALEANISVPFRFAGTAATYLNPGFLRPASELLRKQLQTVGGR